MIVYAHLYWVSRLYLIPRLTKSEESQRSGGPGITAKEFGESNKGETFINIAKHRNGSLDTVKLKALLHIQKFIEEEGGSGGFDAAAAVPERELWQGRAGGMGAGQVRDRL